MAEHPNPRSPDDTALDRLLERLPRTIKVSELHEARQETETMRRAVRRRRRPLGTPARAFMAAALALALFWAGVITERQNRFGPLDLEAVVAAAPALTAGEREVLVQRLGSAYLRALMAATLTAEELPVDVRPRLREPVHAFVDAAAELVDGPRLAGAVPRGPWCADSTVTAVAKLISF